MNEPLGTDYDRAVLRAEKILLPAFDRWRTGGEDGNFVGIGVVVGTLDWMFHEYRQTWSQKTAKRLQPLSPGQCRVHETGIKMICEYILLDGRRLGTRRVSSINTAFVDQLFEKLLFKNVKGEKIERRTTVNHAMKTARSALGTQFHAQIRVCFRRAILLKRWGYNRRHAKLHTRPLRSLWLFELRRSRWVIRRLRLEP